ncbi:hypothetical protein BDY21DRAFT_349731 [Lineolata rhizophorae]|uniref:Protein phosphatase inhibitor 2 n=1 Tax=Lineolata rhizophorae TaxID=578093 RepID=A0A6A6NWD1_9PEZI|nr:hypothetical protein BDY21DRAFT_349731 [Lineolata rhizophorae]
MKITEPKTPFAKQYDPAEDEDEVEAIDAQNLLVDELDKAKSSGSLGADEAAGEHRPKGVKEDEIPGLDIGEPELLRSGNHGTPESEKRVIVDAESGDDVVGATHGEVPPNVSAEELEKHRRFEERRRKHYEMKDVKGLLGHPESIPDDEDEDEADGGVPPPMPKLPDSVRQ